MRQSDINQAFRESVLRNSKGYQYLHTKDFVSALRRRGIHFTEVEANSWNARGKTYFVDSALDHSENRLWIMAEMERELIVERTRAGLAAAREQGRVGGRRRVMSGAVPPNAGEWRYPAAGSRCDRCRRENNLQVPPGDLKTKISLLFLICYVWLNQFIQL